MYSASPDIVHSSVNISLVSNYTIEKFDLDDYSILIHKDLDVVLSKEHISTFNYF